MINPPRWKGPSWTRLYIIRSRRWFKLVAALVFLLGACHALYNLHDARQALTQKFTPTRFSAKSIVQFANPSWRWESEQLPSTRTPSYSREELWEHRSDWKRLGSGSEGVAYVYNGTVVKVYYKGSHPFRNCVPGCSSEQRWPTEIPATVLLGGFFDGKKPLSSDIDFMPIVDYFLSPETSQGPPAWHFVTPHLPAGNLAKLGKYLRKHDFEYTPRELDSVYRPSLEKLLDALDRIHTEHELCHDDVDSDNIFLAAPEPLDEMDHILNGTRHWILADMGNVRELLHPYHSSILWSKQNNNLEDCRANDALRLVKAYMNFFRKAAKDRSKFDVAFLEAREPWSRLFWDLWEDVQAGKTVTAKSVRKMSANVGFSEQTLSASTPRRGAFGVWNPHGRYALQSEDNLEKAVKSVLKIRARDGQARRWGLTPLLGVPVATCDA